MQKLRKYVSQQWILPKNITGLREKFLTAERYERVYIQNFFVSEFADDCAIATSKLTSWKRHETDWFSQDDMRLDSHYLELPTTLQVLTKVLLGTPFQDYVKAITGYSSICQPSLAIHRMKPGDYVDIHNDFVPDGDRVRCILYLGQPASEKPSGVLVALGDEEGEIVLDAYPPIHNSLVIFRISPYSLHAVTEVKDYERLSIILSYKDNSVLG